MEANGRSAEQDYPLLIGAGTLALAHGLRKREKDDARRKKMGRVIQKKAALLTETFPDRFESRVTEKAARDAIARHAWTDETSRTFIVDLAFSDPFAPWDLDFKQDRFGLALKDVAKYVGLPGSFVEEVRDIQKAAARAHHHINVARIAVFGLGGAVVLAAGGWIAAPYIGASLGAAAGLGGAAATNFGLALLGGGSLAAGGFGVAGGMIVVTGVGAAAGFAGASGAELMKQIGARASRAELIKLQTNYKATLLANQMLLAKAQQVVKRLAEQEAAFAAQLKEERELNEANSHRLKDLEATLEAIQDARGWIAKQEAA